MPPRPISPMMRYRPASIAPGRKREPSALTRATGAELVPPDGGCTLVWVGDDDESSTEVAQEGQKRAPSGTGCVQAGQLCIRGVPLQSVCRSKRTSRTRPLETSIATILPSSLRWNRALPKNQRFPVKSSMVVALSSILP